MKVIDLKQLKGKKPTSKCTVQVISKEEHNSQVTKVHKTTSTDSTSSATNQKLVMHTGLKRIGSAFSASPSKSIDEAATTETRGDEETAEESPKTQNEILDSANNAFLTLGKYVGEGAVTASKKIAEMTKGDKDADAAEDRDVNSPNQIQGAFLKLGEFVGEGAVSIAGRAK